MDRNHSQRSAHPLLFYQLRSSLLLALVATLVVATLVYSVSQQVLLDTVENALKQHAEFRSKQVLALYEEKREQLLEVADNIKFRRDLVRLLHSRQQGSEDMEALWSVDFESNLHILGGHIDQFFIFDLDQTLLLSGDQQRYGELQGEELGAFLGDLLDLLQRIQLTAEVEVSRYGFSYLVEESRVWIGAPIFSPYQKRQIGTLVAEFPLQRLRKLMESYSGLGETGEVLMAHWRGGNANSGLNFLNHFRNLEQRQPDHSCIELRKSSPQRFPMTRALSGVDGEGWVLESSCREAYAIWRWLPQLKWGMVVKQDREEMMKPIRKLYLQVALFAVVLFILVAFISYRQARVLSRPIIELKKAVQSRGLFMLPNSKVAEVNSLAEVFTRFSKEITHHAQLLELSYQEQELIIDSISEGLAVLDGEGRMLQVNPAFCRIVGEEAENLIDEWFELLLDGDQLQTSSGDVIPVRVVRTPLEQQSMEVAVVTDMREMLSAERAVRANQAKDQFLAMMSHELRTPLTSIIGYAQILHRTAVAQLNEKQAQMVHSILVSGRTQLTLINDILDLSKIESGKFEIVEEPFDLNEVLQELEDIFSLRARDAGIGFTIDLQTQFRQMLRGDSVRLGQILMNLLSNAVKFTEEGTVALRVWVEERSNRLCFVVQDSGLGMSPEVLNRLFRPFEQADSSITRKFGGTGLGLNISWNLVEMMGGTIQVESEEGKGSRFTVSLPYRPTAEAVVARSATEAAELNEGGLLQGEVLLVEDQPDLQLLVTELLQSAGATVEVAANGQEGMNKALSRGFDLVLMDKQMPVMDGLEAVTSLRQLGYTRPVYALTADVVKGQKEELVEAGCDGVLSKPVDERALLAVLRQYLQPAKEHATGSAAAEPEAEVAPQTPSGGSQGASDSGEWENSHNEIILRLRPLFLQRLKELHQEMGQAVAQENLELLAEDAHILKGSAGSYGYTALGEQAAALDQLFKQQLPTERLLTATRQLLEEMAKEMDEETCSDTLE